MINSQWERLKEPPTPAAASRLTPQEKNILYLQRTLDTSFAEGNLTLAFACLIDLGFFGDALALATTDEQRQLATSLLQAGGRCDCLPIQHEIKFDSRSSTTKVTSNYQAIYDYPQGTLWKCICCDHMTIGLPPDELARHHEEMRVTFPGRGNGPDTHVLKDATDCERCPQE